MEYKVVKKIYLYKCVDRKGTAAMLTVKRSTGFAPDLNLMNLLYAADEAKGCIQALKRRADVIRSPKQGFQ